MLLSEFETLTGIYPPKDLYSVIEEFYNESKLDKQEFCENYKLNADGLAERIQRKVNEMKSESENYIYTLEIQLEAEEKRTDYYRTLLDNELDWRPSERAGTNMNQEDYQELMECRSTTIFNDEKAIDLICDMFGFMPEKIRILHEVQTFEVNKHCRLRVKDTYQREPLYDATDWNYIRFDCAGNQWELVNGELLAYED